MKRLILLLVVALTAHAVPEEETEALRAMRLSCEKQKVALGCFNYANMLVRNEKADQADKYFELGCKLGLEQSCSKEKWDLPERTEAPEVDVLPEAAAQSEASSGPTEDLNSLTPSEGSVTEPSVSE